MFRRERSSKRVARFKDSATAMSTLQGMANSGALRKSGDAPKLDKWNSSTGTSYQDSDPWESGYGNPKRG